MKIGKCSYQGTESWAIVDVSKNVAMPIDGSFSLWASQINCSPNKRSLANSGQEWPLSQVHFLPPVERESKVIAVGNNYDKHASEYGGKKLGKPFAFIKPLGSLIGAFDDIRYPPLSEQLDYEIELVAVIGSKFVTDSDELDTIFGYTIGNDVSARDLLKGPGGAIGMDFLSGKGLDRTSAVGPWIVTADEFGGNAPDLSMVLKVNGEARQVGRTADMIWSVTELLAYVGARTSWKLGDLLFTGTPSKVEPLNSRYLQVGDEIEATIEQIGAMRNVVRLGK
jgi:2-keto-4-pentenoate hydratase/2-oxohepta-3-ene-1,7-dioic acid hydratase in catechol pathway